MISRASLKAYGARRRDRGARLGGPHGLSHNPLEDIMRYAHTIEAIIGSTPLIDLSAIAGGKATILGKYEATNPGGSVKDRIVLTMLDAAEADGSLMPGGTVIKPTSGNTGVGLAMLAARRGYKAVLVMPRDHVRRASQACGELRSTDCPYARQRGHERCRQAR